MTTLLAVQAELTADHPGLTFQTVDKAATAHVDDDRYPELMIGVLVTGVSIVDPYFSSCGRFYAGPEIAYGIPRALADKLLHLNCSCTQSQFLESAPAQYCFVHFHRITEDLIAKTVAMDDLNDALFEFQNHIGINDGGVASTVFCGDWENEWSTATQSRRREMMDHYIAVERNYV